MPNSFNHQKGGPLANLGCGQSCFRRHFGALQSPRKGKWCVASHDSAEQLAKAPFIHDISGKTKWSDLGRFWK